MRPQACQRVDIDRGSKMTFFVEQLNTASDEVVRIGKAETLDDAIAIAKGIVDEFLHRHCYYYNASADALYNASADALYMRYQESGLIPCILRDDGETLNVRGFDHLHYASLQCLRLCKEIQAPTILFAPMNE